MIEDVPNVKTAWYSGVIGFSVFLLINVMLHMCAVLCRAGYRHIG